MQCNKIRDLKGARSLVTWEAWINIGPFSHTANYVLTFESMLLEDTYGALGGITSATNRKN